MAFRKYWTLLNIALSKIGESGGKENKRDIAYLTIVDYSVMLEIQHVLGFSNFDFFVHFRFTYGPCGPHFLVC